MKRIGIVAILIVLIWSSMLKATEINPTFEEAKRAYKKQQYRTALTKFKQIEATGIVSGELFYNIGNTYYHLGKLAQTRLYYEKAKELIPNDQSLMRNLQLLKEQLEDKEEKANVFALSFNVWMNLFSLKHLLWINIGLLSTLTLTLFLLMIHRIRKIHYFLIIVLISVIFNLSLWPRWEAILTRNRGVIRLNRVEVKSGPDQNQSTIFVLHEGSLLQLLSRRDEWAYIRFNTRLRGWVPQKSYLEF